MLYWYKSTSADERKEVVQREHTASRTKIGNTNTDTRRKTIGGGAAGADSLYADLC